MSQNRTTHSKGKQVAMVFGSTSKWQSNGRNTLLPHGGRWGVGGAIAQSSTTTGSSWC
jgi:hypothetical protein